MQDWVATLPCQEDLSSGQKVPSGGERLRCKGEPPAWSSRVRERETLPLPECQAKGHVLETSGRPEGNKFREEEEEESASFILRHFSYQQKADGAKMVMKRQLLLCASCGAVSRERGGAGSGGGRGLSENLVFSE